MPGNKLDKWYNARLSSDSFTGWATVVPYLKRLRLFGFAMETLSRRMNCKEAIDNWVISSRLGRARRAAILKGNYISLYPPIYHGAWTSMLLHCITAFHS